MPDRESAIRKYREGNARTVYDTARVPIDDPRRQDILNKYIYFRQECVGKLALKSGETVLVHCPVNSGPTLGDISWVAWGNNEGIGK